VATLEDLLIKIGIDSKGAKRGAEGLKKDLSKTWDFAKKGAAVGGAAIGVALMAGMQSIIESSKPVALLQAQLGATGDFAGEMGKAAGDLYAKGVVGTMEEATGTIRALWQNGLVPEDAATADIDRIAGKLSTLSMIAEDEAGNVSNAVKQMLRTGLVKNTDEAMDLLVKGVQNGVNKSGDLFDTFNEYGTKFRDLGLSGADSMGLMSQAIRGGARDADTAADALKEFAIRAVDGTKASADGYKALGLDAEKMTAQIAKGGPAAKKGLDTVLDRLRKIEDPVKRGAAAVALFGPKAEDLGQALYSMDVDRAAKGLGNVGGAADKAGKTLEQSAGAKIEAFKRQALNGLTNELAKMIPAIEATFGWLQKNSAWVKPLAIGLTLLAVAIGIIVAVQWAWNAALAISPVTWIVLAVVALIAVIVLIATKTNFFKKTWEVTWNFLKKIGAWFAGPFANFFVMVGKKIAQFAMAAWNVVKAYFGFWNGLYAKLAGWAISAVTKMVNKFTSFVSWVKGIPGRIGGALKGMFTPLWVGFKGAVNRIIGGWNRLQFTIGGGSFAGITFPSASFGTPNIPYLAEGGVVPATPGGRLVVMGEGGEDEVAAPVSKLPDLSGGGKPTVIELHSDGSDMGNLLVKVLRTAVKERGGDVQVVVGQKKKGAR
jgi:hypothetical protein